MEIEVDLAYGFPGFATVGLPDNIVKESKGRIKAAIQNSSSLSAGLVSLASVPETLTAIIQTHLLIDSTALEPYYVRQYGWYAFFSNMGKSMAVIARKINTMKARRTLMREQFDNVGVIDGQGPIQAERPDLFPMWGTRIDRPRVAAGPQVPSAEENGRYGRFSA